MKMSGLFFSKLNNKVHQKPEIRPKNYCFFHDLVVSSNPFGGHFNIEEAQITDEDTIHFTTSRTSFYLCKRFNNAQSFEKMPMLFMKRMSYRRNNKKDQWGRIVYNDSQSKNYDQVTTQFQSLFLLKGSHRVIQLIELLHQNTKSKEDTRLFYQFLRIQDRRSAGIKNICFIFQKMNEGSLRDRIQRIIIKKQDPLTEQQVIQITCQIAEGLLILKNKGIIHRDLRPDNILIHNGQIKFSNFDSAFIRGYSDFKNIKNGVDMMDTTPLEIMLLIAESQDKLKSLTSEQLYQLQVKADIYYLGINIYCMVYSQPFESFNTGRILNNLINIKKRSGFCPKLLDLMARCLQKNSHVRIDLDDAIKILIEIEKETYLKNSTYNHIHLGVQPLNLSSFSSTQKDSSILIQSIINNFSTVKYDRISMEKYFEQALQKSTVERNTSRYEIMMRNIMEDTDTQNLWSQNKKSQIVKNQAESLRVNIQAFLQRMQIKAYYYEFAYRILSEVNLDCVKSMTHRQNIRTHLDLFSHELSVILTFIYDMLMRCSFTSDPSYDSSNISYENRRVFENIKILYSRRQFFAGRKKLMQENNFNIDFLQQKLEEFRTIDSGERHDQEVRQIQEGIKLLITCKQTVQILEEKIVKFKQIQYQSSENKYLFSYEYTNIRQTLLRMQKLIREETKQTIISLILAYQQIKLQPWGHLSNLKNAIFMLMILQAQDTEKIHKNDMVIIKEQLSRMIHLQLGWKSEQLQAFFNNYTQIHHQKVIKGLNELKSHAALADDQEDIFVQASDVSIHDNVQKVVEKDGLERNQNIHHRDIVNTQVQQINKQRKQQLNTLVVIQEEKKIQKQIVQTSVQDNKVSSKVQDQELIIQNPNKDDQLQNEQIGVEQIVQEPIKTILIQVEEKAEEQIVQSPQDTNLIQFEEKAKELTVLQPINKQVIQVQEKHQEDILEQVKQIRVFQKQQNDKQEQISEGPAKIKITQNSYKLQETTHQDLSNTTKEEPKVKVQHKIQALDLQQNTQNDFQDAKYKSFYRNGLRFLTTVPKQ